VEELAKRGELAAWPDGLEGVVPAANKIELYLTYHCNDRCQHCITRSGPERRESMPPERVAKVLGILCQYSVVERLRQLLGEGVLETGADEEMTRLAGLPDPPARLDGPLQSTYARLLQGGGTSRWRTRQGSVEVPLGRPSIRLSGGEFYTWPVGLPESERLQHQAALLGLIRRLLPEYDVWVLTNGRFARDEARARRVVAHWGGAETSGGGQIRICISVDAFHRPPAGSTTEQMLTRLWQASRSAGLAAPFLYGIPNNRVGLVGRAFETMSPGTLEAPDLRHGHSASVNPLTALVVDPIDLMATDGCRELQGFYCAHADRGFPVHNVVVAPSGHLTYCCACVGDYGDLLTDPRRALQNMAGDPVARMLRQGTSAARLLATAARLDPSVLVVGSGENAAATGCTCYQVLSGVRLPGTPGAAGVTGAG